MMDRGEIHDDHTTENVEESPEEVWKESLCKVSQTVGRKRKGRKAMWIMITYRAVGERSVLKISKKLLIV
jgi:hypothetical protein